MASVQSPSLSSLPPIYLRDNDRSLFIDGNVCINSTGQVHIMYVSPPLRNTVALTDSQLKMPELINAAVLHSAKNRISHQHVSIGVWRRTSHGRGEIKTKGVVEYIDGERRIVRCSIRMGFSELQYVLFINYMGILRFR
jgi:hypothetical protein